MIRIAGYVVKEGILTKEKFHHSCNIVRVWEEKDIDMLIYHVLEIKMLATSFHQETAATTCDHILRKINDMKNK